jgi:hypothetical protein
MIEHCSIIGPGYRFIVPVQLRSVISPDLVSFLGPSLLHSIITLFKFYV